MNTMPPRLLQQLHERFAGLPKAQQQVVGVILEDPESVIAATIRSGHPCPVPNTPSAAARTASATCSNS